MYNKLNTPCTAKVYILFSEVGLQGNSVMSNWPFLITSPVSCTLQITNS